MNQNRVRPFTVAACMLFLAGGYAQVTTPANQPSGGGGDFVGWDNTVINDPLMIRHDANQPIQFFTDARFRMLLNPSITYGTLGSFTNIPADGFALITPNTSFLSAVIPFRNS